MKQIKSKALFRELEIREADKDTRKVELVFSSETPVDRWFGREILDHDAEAVRLDRMKNGGPVLVGHNPDDHVGVVEEISIADRIGRAVVRFGRSARASEILDDIVDGIRKGVSVGYRIHEMILESRGQDDVETYRATDWEPFEISIVSIPADPTAAVGVGRAEIDEELEIRVTADAQTDTTEKEIKPMENKDEKRADPAITPDDVRAASETAAEAAQKVERERVDAIMSVAEKRGAGELARKYVADGSSPEDFFRALLEMDDDVQPVAGDAGSIGLTPKEVRQFSFLKAIRAQLPGATRSDIAAAAFEREVSEAAAEQYKRQPQGFLIPDEVLREKRDLTVGTATAGGHTVATELDAANFIDLLRNAMVVEASGARVLTGLQGNLAIPRQTGGATTYWVAEGAAPTESQQAFDQVSLTPKTVGAFTDFSRKLVLQSSIDVENFVRGDLATAIGVELDRVAIEGDPDTTATQYEPRGILNQSGIGAVALGTNGAAPVYDDIVDLIKEVAIDNAMMGSLGFITNAQAWAKLAKTKIDTGSGQFIIPPAVMDRLNGFPLRLSQNVPADLAKGSGSSLSALIFGNFADLILGYWSGVDLLVDPYTASTTGTVRVVALTDVDTAVRHAESFAAITDMVTT